MLGAPFILCQTFFVKRHVYARVFFRGLALFSLIPTCMALSPVKAAPEDEDHDPVPIEQGLRRGLPLEWMPLDRAVGLYSNAEAAPILKLIQSARRRIDVEIYEMEDRDVLAGLVQALKVGVKVRVLEDPRPVGSKCDWFHLGRLKSGCGWLAPWLANFRALGGEFRPFNRQTLCKDSHRPCFEHGKMILVDESLAAISTGNFNVTSLCDRKFKPRACNRDYTYLTRDAAVLGALKKIFAGDWRGDPGPLDQMIRENKLPKKLTVSPYSRAPLTAFILSAKREVLFQNQYLSDDDLAARIIEFKKAHPEVRIKLNLTDVCEFGRIPESKRYRARLMFAALADVGVETRMFPKQQRVGSHRGYLHAKAIVVDGERAWIGSVNGSATSLDHNREYGIFMTQGTRVNELRHQLLDDFSNPRSLSWQQSVLECPTDDRRGLAAD